MTFQACKIIHKMSMHVGVDKVGGGELGRIDGIELIGKLLTMLIF